MTYFGTNVDGDDSVGAPLFHDVGGLVVAVATVQQHVAIPGVADGRQVDGDAHRRAGVNPRRSEINFSCFSLSW